MKGYFKLLRQRRNYYVISMGLMLGAFSCAGSIMSYDGQTAYEAERIPLPTKELSDSVWQTKDLEVHYRARDITGRLDIAGDIRISSHIANSYPIVQYFFYRISFLNGQGQVILTRPISLSYQARSEIPEVLKFSVGIEYPLDATAFAFSYHAKFSDRHDEYGETDAHIIDKTPFYKTETSLHGSI